MLWLLHCSIFLLWILKSCELNLELTNIEDKFRFIHVQKHLVGNYAAAWRYGMQLQDVIQFQASKGKKRRLLGKYCNYLMEDWLDLQRNFFLKYFTSPFRRKQLFVSIVWKVYLYSQAWLSAKPCAWFKFVASYWFYYFM